MSKWSNILLDINYMKQYAAGAAKVVTINVSRLGIVDEERMKDAAIGRFWLDKLLLDEEELNIKWSQYFIREIDDKLTPVSFRCNKRKNIEFIKQHKSDWFSDLELVQVLPDNKDFSWNRYFREIENRSNIEIQKW